MRRAVVLLAVAACSGGGPQQIGAQPSWRHGTPPPPLPPARPAAPVTLPASADAVARYNEPVQPPPHTPLGDATLAAVRDAAQKLGIQPPVADARLFKTCTELAGIVSEAGVVSYSLEEFAMQRNGIIEPSPRVIVTWARVDDVDAIIDQLRPLIPEILADGDTARVGIGAAKRAADGTGAIVFALQASGVSTNPIPRSLSSGGSALLDAVIDARFHEPEVFVTHEDGATEQLALDRGKSGGFKTRLACSKHSGRQQVEISASGAHGAEVLANFPVWCGAEPPATLTVDPASEAGNVASVGDAEKQLLALMNRDRQAAGLPALVWDDRVADVARKHSEEMQRTKIVAHIISPASGSADDRVKAAGIKTGLVLENVARAYGVGQAHQGLMNSPGHRANLMSAAATHVGIGVVLGDEVPGGREMFVTQVFIRVPPKVDPAQAAELVRARIEKIRRVSVSAKLASVAQHLADGLAAGNSRDSLWPQAEKQLDSVGGSYQRMGSTITAVADLDTLDAKEILGGYKPDDVGIGIAQGPHPVLGENAVWVVVLMAERLPQQPTAPAEQRSP